jgi:hypothetical protein
VPGAAGQRPEAAVPRHLRGWTQQSHHILACCLSPTMPNAVSSG